MRSARFLSALLVAIVFSVATAPVHATLVSGWGAEPGNTNGTVTDGPSAGGFSTTAPTGNLTPRALLASPVTLTNVGDQIVVSGQVAAGAGINGNQSFRAWLVNSNGNATGTLTSGVWNGAAITGWLGYGFEVANLLNNNGNFQIMGLSNPNSGGWFSNTGAYTLSQLPAASLNAPATYNFNLTLTLASASSINVAYSFGDTGGTFTSTGNFTDPGNAGGGSVSTKTFNALGFLQNTSSGGAMTYSNVDVTFIPVPEPATFGLAALAGIGLVLVRRKS